MSDRKKKHNHGGRFLFTAPESVCFTLLEVLATMLVVGIVLPVAMHGISLCVTTAGETVRRREAVILAETKINEIQLGETENYFEISGDFGEDWPEYRWRTEVEPWEISGLRQLTVYVEWHRGGRWRGVSLSSLVTD